MRVDVFINAQAGKANSERIQSKIREALYRCELKFILPESVSKMQEALITSIDEGVGFLLICGGDGTLNLALRPIMDARNAGKKIPPILNIPVGTANDLAWEVGISRRVDKAARAIFEGDVKTVDLIEISSGGKTSYMITNGGMGIPAQTARGANLVRKRIRHKLLDSKLPKPARAIYSVVRNLVRFAGSKIYDVILVGDMWNWDRERWEAEIEIPGKTRFTTHAPFILINNQPTVGGKFTPAPFTTNTDGTFNVLLIEPTKLLPQVKSILDIRLGRIPDADNCPSFETKELKIRATDASKPLTFFGDGEILQKNAREMTIRCVHPGLPIVTMEEQ